MWTSKILQASFVKPVAMWDSSQSSRQRPAPADVRERSVSDDAKHGGRHPRTVANQGAPQLDRDYHDAPETSAAVGRKAALQHIHEQSGQAASALHQEIQRCVQAVSAAFRPAPGLDPSNVAATPSQPARVITKAIPGDLMRCQNPVMRGTKPGPIS